VLEEARMLHQYFTFILRINILTCPNFLCHTVYTLQSPVQHVLPLHHWGLMVDRELTLEVDIPLQSDKCMSAITQPLVISYVVIDTCLAFIYAVSMAGKEVSHAI